MLQSSKSFPWFFLPIACAFSLQGSYDTCNDGRINWEEVHKTVFDYVVFNRYDDNFEWVHGLAVQGPDQDISDCWYGWVTLRFFLFLVTDATHRATWLSDRSSFSFEWSIWVASPWREHVASRWDILRIFSGIRSLLQNDGTKFVPDFRIEDCSQAQQTLLNLTRLWDENEDDSLERDTDFSAEWGYAAISVIQEEEEGTRLTADATDCQVHASIAARATLGILPPPVSHATPGYALRTTQDIFSDGAYSSTVTALVSLALSPWPIFSLLRRLLQRVAGIGERPDMNTEDNLTEAVMTASMEEFPNLPSSSFLPPISRRERLRLLETLQMVHTVLESARIGYVAMTGTVLGALRHHGFVPWDGDADVCIDIRDEPRLFLLALLQSTCKKNQFFPGSVAELQTAACLLADAGFELYAHADRPLTYKMAAQFSPRVAGRPYGYPYVDLWFCHGWSEGQFSMQSASYGVPIPREYVFPRRKVFFAGLMLWTFADPFKAVSAYYYTDAYWFDNCIGHETFHRQERKYSREKERDRGHGNVPCHSLTSMFAFATYPSQGFPEGLLDEEFLLPRLQSWFSLRGSVKWSLVFGGEDRLSFGDEWPKPLSFPEAILRPSHIISVSSSILHGPQKDILHHLSDVRLALQQNIFCDIVLRFLPLKESELSTQLVGASSFLIGAEHSTAYSPLFQSKLDSLWRMEVPSCVCRRKLGSLNLEWVSERL